MCITTERNANKFMDTNAQYVKILDSEETAE